MVQNFSNCIAERCVKCARRYMAPFVAPPRPVSASELSGVKYAYNLAEDVIQLQKIKKPTVPKITISGAREEWGKLLRDFAERHTTATEKYGLLPKKMPKLEVPYKDYSVVNSVQFETEMYRKLNKKAHAGLKLTPAEEEYYKRIVDSMTEVKEDQFVVRYMQPYEGLEEELQSGALRFRGLTSCTTENNQYFMRWGRNLFAEKEVGSQLELTPPYLLKVNLKSGQKVLNCNVTHKGEGVLMDTEVVLPEGKGIIRKIDDELHYIEVDFVPNP